jgi:hypothetical protein
MGAEHERGREERGGQRHGEQARGAGHVGRARELHELEERAAGERSRGREKQGVRHGWSSAERSVQGKTPERDARPWERERSGVGEGLGWCPTRDEIIIG